MFMKRYVWHIMKYSKSWDRNYVSPRFIHNSRMCQANDSKTNKSVPMITINFETAKVKTRNSYLEMVKLFTENDLNRRGHVEFIYSALKHMESYGVQKDLEVYKALLNVLPKGKFIPQNVIQSEFMHYPKQQQCAIDVLEQMEDNGVLPDHETEDILMNVFGKRGYPLRKLWRMLYWMPKFKNLSPWAVPNPPPNDALELAKLAIQRISVDLQHVITIYQTSDIQDSIDDTWIVSSQAPEQIKLLADHNAQEAIYVEGPFVVWLRTESVNYFVLRAQPKPLPEAELVDTDDVSNLKVPFLNVLNHPKPSLITVPSVHEQEDGVIFALCATGTSSKDSLLSWIRHLEKTNPILKDCPVVFTLRQPESGLVNVVQENVSPATTK